MQFRVTIAADVPVGVYDVRARSLYGLSNPRTFIVGDRKEVVEVEPNNTPDKPMTIELNSVVNGKSDGGADVDWYKFAAKAGQRVIVELRSKQIDSRMEGAASNCISGHASARPAHHAPPHTGPAGAADRFHRSG